MFCNTLILRVHVFILFVLHFLGSFFTLFPRQLLCYPFEQVSGQSIVWKVFDDCWPIYDL